MPYTPHGVVSYGFPFEDFTFTYELASAIVVGDVGKAVAVDASAGNTVKLAGDGDAIFGRLETFEDRTLEGIKVGAVSRKFKAKLKAVASHGLAVGDAVCGSTTAGVVRKAVLDVDTTSGAAKVATSDPITNVVVEVLADNFVVVESL